MKREFTDENFEEFLKRNADNLRMKAPEHVWQKLSSDLNKGRRRFRAGLSAFLLLTATLAYLTISNTSKQALLSKEPSYATKPRTTIPSGQQNGRATTNRSTTTTFSQQQPVSRNNRANGLDLTPEAMITTTTAPFSGIAAPVQPETAAQAVAQGDGGAPQSGFTATIVDDDPNFVYTAPEENTWASKPAFLSAHGATAPFTIESVINSYHRKKSRFQTEFHFSPTISYRKLSENKSYLRTTPGLRTSNYAALTSSVNNMVTHKPDIGFELGVTEKYSLSNKIRIRAGLQFNVNRYDIKAFQAPFALATIALNTRGSARLDSVYTLSSYSNVNGSSNKSSWLQNLSFQVSAPVGVELALKGNDKMQFGIATTIQPTYVLGDRAYLITNDYKSYTQVPWLLRRWNVNTALETFVSYKTGKTQWQVGPQVRYQLLSSFISNYPVKENLFDFGLRIGVSVNK